MSQFTDVLVVSPLADGKTWVIVRDFGYDVGAENSGDHIDVAIGFKTDFATIPRLFWVILPKWGRYGNATSFMTGSTGSRPGRAGKPTRSSWRRWACWA